MITKLLAVALAIVLVGACGGDDDDNDADSGVDISGEDFDDLTAESSVEVDAIDNSFRPQYVEVKAGTTITFVNDGRNVHNVIPASEGAFTSVEADDFAPDDEATLVLESPGDYAYYCSLHGTPDAGMIGGIRVVD